MPSEVPKKILKLPGMMRKQILCEKKAKKEAKKKAKKKG